MGKWIDLDLVMRRGREGWEGCRGEVRGGSGGR